MQIAILVMPETNPASLGIVREIFRLVRRRVESMHGVRSDVGMVTPVLLLSLDGRPVRLVDGSAVPIDGAIAVADPAQGIVLPDIDPASTVSPETLSNRALVRDWLVAASAAGATIAASGASLDLVADARLLEGPPMWAATELPPPFRARYPALRGTYHGTVLDRGRLLVSRGLAGDPEVMVRFVERLLAPELAGWLARRIGLSLAGDWTLSDDPLVADAQVWFGLRYADTPRLRDLAHALAVSEQTLLRRFKTRLGTTPRAYVRSLRITAACRQLEHSARSIAQIASLVGYEDPKAFRAAFRSETGMTATAYRRDRNASVG